MNKFTIPTILVATIMVAGIFALVPVEQASSVHLSGTAIAGAVSANVVVTGSIIDDEVGPEDVTGATDAAGFVHVEEQTSTIVSVATTTFSPVVQSLAIVTCDIEGTAAGAIVDGTVTLDDGGNAGTIESDAEREISEAILSGDILNESYTWYVSGLPAATAVVYTCTAGGTGVDGTDVSNFEIIALFIPE